MLNATLELVQENDPRTPPAFRNGFDEHLKTGGRPTSDWLSRPWVCTVPKYNFVLYNVFTYGVMDASDWSTEWYNEQMVSFLVIFSLQMLKAEQSALLPALCYTGPSRTYPQAASENS